MPGATDDVFFDGVGTGASNSTISASQSIKSLDMTGYANTLTQNCNMVLTIAGNGATFKFSSGMTYTPVACGITGLAFTGTSGTTLITTAGKTVKNLTFNGSGGTFQLQDDLTSSGLALNLTNGTFDPNGKTVTLNAVAGDVTLTGSFTFYNLIRNSYTRLTLASDQIVTNNLTLAGSSEANRLLVTSSILGTQRSITNTGATMTWSYVDFRDIALSSSYNASAITGYSGDAGGNTGITFTTAQDNYWVSGTGSWSDSSKWKLSNHSTAGRVPLPQDGVKFDASSFTAGSQIVTLNMLRAGKDIDWTGVTNTPTWAKTTAATIYGSTTLVSGMINTGTASITMEGRGPFTFTTAGQTWTNPTTVAMIGGNLTLQDAFNSSATTTLTHGTFNANNLNVTAPAFSITGTNTRTLTMGSGTWTATSSGTVWDATIVTNLTLNPNTSTIVIPNTTTATKTFIGGGLTYNNITFTGDNTVVTGSNTFNTLAVNNAGLSNGLKLTSGTTQTVSNITTNGSTGNLAKLLSTPSGISTVSKSSGTVSLDYMSIASSTATGGATWYAGANSTNVGNNTGWLFTSPDTTPALLQTVFESITATSATASSTITSIGGSSVTNRGFAYGTDSTFATVIATTTEAGSFGTGSFTSSLTSLSCNTTYYVRAYAVNSYGTSTSASANFTTSACVPAIPTDVAAGTNQSSQASITFTPGSNGGSAILYYLASSTPGNITATSTGSPITVTGLTNGVSYTFQVYAVNAIGTSTPSTASNSVTPDANAWGLAGHWTFDTTSTNWSASTTADTSGNSNTGTLTNFYSSTSTIEGFSNQALYINGGTEYVDAGNTASLSPTTAITVSAWVKPVGAGASSYLTILNKTNSYSLSIRQDGVILMYLTGVNNWVTGVGSTGKNLFDGAWHHIVGTYDGSLQSLYIDNLLVATTTATGSFTTNSNTMRIGTSFKGGIDDVRVYGAGLTVADVETLYASYGTSHSPRTYYVSQSLGDDSNDGLSEQTAWQNLDTIYEKSLIPNMIIPGDSLLLRRGDTWEGQIKIDRLGDSSGLPITIGAYGTGNKPLIYGDGRNLVWSAVPGYAGVYEANVGAGGSIQAVYENNTAYTVDTTPLDLVASTWGQPYGRKDIVWIYTSDGNAPNNIRVFRNPTIKISNSNNIIVEDLDIQETWTAVYVDASDSVNVRNLNTLNTQDVSVYFGVDTNSIMDNITATSSGNTVLYILVGSNNIIRNNTIGAVYDTISGISTPGSDNAGIGLQQSKYNIIEYNHFVNSGALDYYYELGSIVRYNYFENTNGFYPHGSANIVYGNIINGNGIHTAFNAGGVPADFLSWNTYGNYGEPVSNQMLNNTFYNIGSYAMMASYGANGLIIRNNIVYGNAAVDLTLFTDTGGTVDSDYNCYYTSSPYTGAPHFKVNGVLHQSFSAFQATGHDPNSVYGNPLLDANYRLASTSPCRNTGTDISDLLNTPYTDYYSNPIYGTSDIGAVEYQPPFTLGMHLVDVSGDFLIYGDRKYEYTSATSSTMSADFNVTPAEGSWTYSASSTRPEWLNVSISTWDTSDTYSKAWTASSSNATTTIYVIGDMSPNTYYDIAVDGTSTSTLQANSSGRITYTYSGGYSSHTFTVVPAEIVATATAYTFTGPTSGNAGSASTAFTVTPNDVYTGTITITPTGTGSTGMSPTILTFSNSSTPQTFTITPTVTGSITLTSTNNGGLSNPSNIVYTVNSVDTPVVVTPPTSSSGEGSSSSSSVLSRINNLIAMGQYEQARQLANQYGIAMPAIPVATSTTASNIPRYVFTRQLTLGMIGADVKQLQMFLNSSGYTVTNVGPGSADNETQMFGYATQLAIKKFQCAQKIACSGAGYGMVGPRTLAALNTYMRDDQIVSVQATLATISTATSTFSRTLTLGSVGIDVKQLQTFLNTHGYAVANSGPGSLGNETTVFGPATRSALIRFQTSKGISPAVGYFGPVTRKMVEGMK